MFPQISLFSFWLLINDSGAMTSDSTPASPSRIGDIANELARKFVEFPSSVSARSEILWLRA